MDSQPSASYSVILRCEIPHRPGQLGRVASAIGAAGGEIGAIDIVHAGRAFTVRDITIDARNETNGREIVERVCKLEDVKVICVRDRTFRLHQGGMIEVKAKVPVRDRDDLSMAYTPGVARICRAIADDPARVRSLTIKQNSVAVVTDGSAVLGMGNIGPEAALPVMEGKALLFKEFGNVNAFPICLSTQHPDEIVAIVQAIAPGFGGINLEDIAAPRCFEIETRLRKALNIPVFHDDQHGTAVVIIAALKNALKIVDKELDDVKIVVSGMGAAGVATTRMLIAAGVRDIIGFDRAGAVYAGRVCAMNPAKDWIARHTNLRRFTGDLAQALDGADVFIGVSAAGLLQPKAVAAMARDPIVFALANPEPEVRPEDIVNVVRVMATGRSDYPNQINNVLCFPGMFRGALDCDAVEVNEAMNIAAASAIAAAVTESELSEEYIIPSVFNSQVVPRVASSVIQAAVASGVARRADLDYAATSRYAYR